MFDDLFFIHIPKTGGTYVRYTLKSISSCIDHGMITHSTYSECQHLIKDKVPFTVVRNPYDWIASWYYFEHTRSKKYKRDPNVTKYKTFEDFILNKGFYNLNRPLIQSQYTTGIDKNNILKQENLIQDLDQFLKSNGYKFILPKEKIRENKLKQPIVWSNKMKDIFLSKYLEDFLNFGYAY